MSNILQSCDTRTVGSNSWLMVHGFSAEDIFDKDLKDKKVEQAFLESVTKRMASLYSKRNTSKIGKYHTVEYWSDILQENTPRFFNAEESIICGIADRIE